MTLGVSLPSAAATTLSTSGSASGSTSGWPEGVALAGAGLLVLVAVGWVCWRGWRAGHPAEDALRPLPPSPEDLGDVLAGPYKGRYLATTDCADVSLVVSSLGLAGPSAASVAVTHRGVFVEREGSELLYIPAESLTGAHVETATGGTPFGLGALLVIGWKHGRRRWQSGFRAISVRRHAELATAIEALRAGTPVARPTGNPVAIPEVPL